MSRTAQYVALYRALETNQRLPLFRDRFAEAFLPRKLVLAVRAAKFRPIRSLLLEYADRRAPGARTSAIARTCFIDDCVTSAVSAGVEQLVLLGAGFDCRAHRIPELASVAVFEVDRADTQTAKRRVLARARAPIHRDVHYVSVDFLRDDLDERLRSAGFRHECRTLLVWEGVTNYLTRPSVESVLAWMGRMKAQSRVVFTYVHRGLLDGSSQFEGGSRILQNVTRLSEPWTFGLKPDEVAAFLDRFGLELIEDLGADEYRARYLGRAPRTRRGYAFYRIAVADVR